MVEEEMFEFCNEALRLIADYVKDVRDTVVKFGFDIKSEYLEMVMFDIENHIKFFSIRHARQRKAGTVEADDVRYALQKFGKPEKLVKVHLMDPEACANVQRITLNNLEAIKEKINKTKAPVVLDAGCGWGRFSRKLHGYVAQNCEMIGIDLDFLSLQYGKTINEAATFLQSEIQALPFQNEVFDVIMCSGVIHEVKNTKERKKTLQEFARVMKTNGQLYMVDAFTEHKFVNIFTRLLQYVPKLEIEWIFHKSQLERLLQESGFKITAVEKTGSRVLSIVTGYTFTAIKSEEGF
jgi:ubiquinone/menaquinone biosynthesis C-methylase UbiE